MTTWDPSKWTYSPKGATMLTDEQVIDIIQTRGKTTHRQAAEKHGISISGVRHIRYGVRRRELWLEVQEMNKLL